MMAFWKPGLVLPATLLSVASSGWRKQSKFAFVLWQECPQNVWTPWDCSQFPQVPTQYTLQWGERGLEGGGSSAGHSWSPVPLQLCRSCCVPWACSDSVSLLWESGAAWGRCQPGQPVKAVFGFGILRNWPPICRSYNLWRRNVRLYYKQNLPNSPNSYPLVTTTVLSVFMIFFWFYCKWYNIEFVFLCSAYLTKHNALKIHLQYHKCWDFFLCQR